MKQQDFPVVSATGCKDCGDEGVEKRPDALSIEL